VTTTTQRVTPVVRKLTSKDAEDIFGLATAYDLERYGRVETTLADVTPDRPGSNRHWFGVDVDGRLTLAGNVGWWEGEAGAEADITGPPGVEREAWSALFERLRAEARERYPDRPFHFFVDDGYPHWRAWAEAAGAGEIRRFYRMAIDLAEPPPAPVLGPGVAIRPIVDAEPDLRTVFGVVDTAFRDHWGADGDSDYDQFIGHACAEGRYDPTLWWIAEVDGVPAAVLIGRAYDGVGHVGTLGTLREFRGRGIARALLLTSFDEFYRRGLVHVSLGVDATNPTGALRLYESAGMRPSVTWVCYEVPNRG
jgi:ribosomal protein S18 acetylase RimI-like enzyme